LHEAILGLAGAAQAVVVEQRKNLARKAEKSFKQVRGTLGY